MEILRENLLKVYYKLHYSPIHDHVSLLEPLTERDTLERPTTRQRHIELSMRKCPPPYVYRHFVESLSLTLVYSERYKKVWE